VSDQPFEPNQQVDVESGRPLVPSLQPGEVIPQRERSLQMMEEFRRSRRSMQGLTEAIVPQGLIDFINEKPANYTFPEPLFRQHFLPFFSGQAKATREINFSVWIEKVAGGESRAVDVVDENGNVLFTVPGLHDQGGVELTKSGRGMTHVERQYVRLKEVSISDSQEFLASSLTSMHIAATTPDVARANAKAWNDIFRRYGLEDKIINLIPEGESTGNKNAGSAIPTETDRGVYDGGMDFT
jgi:hypothetical protein